VRARGGPTSLFFLATVFTVTFEKVHWQVAGTVELPDVLAILFLLGFSLDRAARSDGRVPRSVLVASCFLGDSRAADREWAEGLGLGDRLELISYAPRRRSLELQRDSEALLLLIPDAAGRGRGVLSGKVFEYLAAERPILAVVPPEGAAAELIRAAGAGLVVAPDDVDGIAAALRNLHAAWRAGTLEGTPLTDDWKRKLSRRSRSEDFVRVLEDVVG